jgi:uncharacterized protein with PQ loop repeat
MYQQLGYVSQLFFALCLLPQVIKIYITKTTKGISWIMWALQLAGYFFGLIYGFGIKQNPLIIGNSWGIICTILFTTGYLKYRDQ